MPTFKTITDLHTILVAISMGGVGVGWSGVYNCTHGYKHKHNPHPRHERDVTSRVLLYIVSCDATNEKKGNETFDYSIIF